MNYSGVIGAGILSPENVFNSAPKSKPKKQCINCGEEHEHNNSFCSAECCKKFNGK